MFVQKRVWGLYLPVLANSDRPCGGQCSDERLSRPCPLGLLPGFTGASLGARRVHKSGHGQAACGSPWGAQEASAAMSPLSLVHGVHTGWLRLVLLHHAFLLHSASQAPLTTTSETRHDSESFKHRPQTTTPRKLSPALKTTRHPWSA